MYDLSYHGVRVFVLFCFIPNKYLKTFLAAELSTLIRRNKNLYINIVEAI